MGKPSEVVALNMIIRNRCLVLRVKFGGEIGYLDWD